MFRSRRLYSENDAGLITSRLYDQQSFYPAFVADTKRATESIIIESPFISYRRLNWLYPSLESAAKRGIKVIVNTKDPREQDIYMRTPAEVGIQALQDLGVLVLFTGGHHRKLAIIDRQITWEGSLNILSQTDSCEVMRRIESAELTEQMIQFIGLERWYTK